MQVFKAAMHPLCREQWVNPQTGFSSSRKETKNTAHRQNIKRYNTASIHVFPMMHIHLMETPFLGRTPTFCLFFFFVYPSQTKYQKGVCLYEGTGSLGHYVACRQDELLPHIKQEKLCKLSSYFESTLPLKKCGLPEIPQTKAASHISGLSYNSFLNLRVFLVKIRH